MKGMNKGVFGRGLKEDRFNMETEGFINREERGCGSVGGPQETK